MGGSSPYRRLKPAVMTTFTAVYRPAVQFGIDAKQLEVDASPVSVSVELTAERDDARGNYGALFPISICKRLYVAGA